MRTAFTLIEVTVALALGGLLLVGVHALTVSAHRAHTTLVERQHAADQAAWPVSLLRRDLQQRTQRDALTLRDGVLTVSTLNACFTARSAARHAVAVRYQAVEGAWKRQEREPQDAGVRWQSIRLPWRTAGFEVFDGQTWSSVWPTSVYRAPRGLRLTASSSAGQQAAWTIPLGPHAWERPR
jgi:prepilin-type N-terminal cleavage/methylation domain-containing protein